MSELAVAGRAAGTGQTADAGAGNNTGGRIFRRLPAAAARCYLTFDDGPHHEFTPRVLDMLAASDTRASFFVVGQLARKAAPLLRRMQAAGHAIGNHGSSHAHPWLLTAGRARQEVRDGADAIAQAIGAAPQWFRPPHGRLGPFLLAAVRAEGQDIALWTRSAVDWGPLASASRIEERLRDIGAGEIVLLHDGPLRHNRPDQTLQVLPGLLAALASRGPASAALPPVATMQG